MKKAYIEKIMLFWNKFKLLISVEFGIALMVYSLYGALLVYNVKLVIIMPVIIFVGFIFTLGNVNTFLTSNYAEIINSKQKFSANAKIEYILISVLGWLFIISMGICTIFICIGLKVELVITLILCIHASALSKLMMDIVFHITKKRHEMFIEMHSKEKEVLEQPKEDNKI